MFEQETTLWLIVLLEGNDVVSGWRGRMIKHSRIAQETGRADYAGSAYTAAIMVADLERELSYRLFGELTPSGD